MLDGGDLCLFHLVKIYLTFTETSGSFFTKLYCNTKKIVMRCNQDGYALCLEEFNLASPTKKSKTKKFL